MTPKAWSASPDEVRARFLEFFKERGHEVRPSASLVPENDPSLLFIGAGMAPFKDHFLGRVPLTFRRAASSQKCLRTGDLENVGRTPGHHTFFEMLGNFSFGDYFKEEAIGWAWEFLTSEKWLAMPKERLRVSVYQDDEEAAGLWKKVAGLGDDRIARLGAKSNFWPANAPEDGPDGPCGPCSEIFFDLGYVPAPEGLVVPCSPGFDCMENPKAESVDCNCHRFIEIWNLVFQQFDRKGANNLVPLAMQNIDTGAGFERLLMVLRCLLWEANGRDPGHRIESNFQTPLLQPLVQFVMDIPSSRSATSNRDWVRGRRIADHVRAATFCIADGVRPSNEGRGYVLRRIIRRAVRDGIQLGIAAPFLHDCVRPLRALMGAAYPDLQSGGYVIRTALRAEEDQFRKTYEAGLDRLLDILRPHGNEEHFTLPGDQAFLLHDTYGFPVDVTSDILREQGFALDQAGFERSMEKARQRSREGSKMATDIFAGGPLDRVKRQWKGTTFLGYGMRAENDDGSYDWAPGVDVDETFIDELLVANAPVDRMEPGQEGAVILRGTPFYAEQGGQVGDTGEIRGPGGAVFKVRDTQKVESFHLHLGTLEGGPLKVGDATTAAVDRLRRDAVRRNHTATHLLHRVLKEVLGEDARQAGSLVAPDYLRFDFTWPKALTAEERERIEAEVNRRVYENHAVRTRVHTLEEARATGAVSMFGEKYGSRVRVLTAGDSKEFCGGTHCHATGDIGSFRITAEKSIGSGLRRIEAVTGERAVREFQDDRRRLQELAAEVERLKKEASKAAKRVAAPAATADLDPMRAPRKRAGPLEFAVLETEGAPDGVLLGAGDRVKADAGGPFAILVCSRAGDAVALLAAGNPAAVKSGFAAGAAVGAAAKALGGGGGGRPDLARGKGSDPSRIPAALQAFESYLASLAG